MVNFDQRIGLARPQQERHGSQPEYAAALSKNAMAASPAGKNQLSRLNLESEMVASWCGLAKALLAKPELCQGALGRSFFAALDATAQSAPFGVHI